MEWTIITRFRLALCAYSSKLKQLSFDHSSESNRVPCTQVGRDPVKLYQTCMKLKLYQHTY